MARPGTFPPGVSGNPNGRPKRRQWTEAILEAVETIDENTVDKRTRLRSLADALVKAGLAGEVAAIRELGDRIEGKVPQAIIGDSDADPINVVQKIVREVVRPNAKNSNS